MDKLLIKGVFILILEEAMMNGSCGQGKNKILRRLRNNKYYYACWRIIPSNLLIHVLQILSVLNALSICNFLLSVHS